MTAGSDTSDDILASLDAEYQEGFAGQERTTVDAGKLEGMIGRAKGALKGAGAMSESLADGLKDRLARFEKELEMIRAAQSGGGTPREFGLLGRAANLLFAQYGRHFAGKSRATRDAALLSEIIAELEVVQKGMSAMIGKKASKGMKDDLGLVTERLATYKNEREEIAKAFQTASNDQKVTHLADRANAQFRAYADLFANKGRLTRRPALLERIIGTLETIHGEMDGLSGDDFDRDVNTQNMKIVSERLGRYRTELGDIRKVRDAATTEDIMNNLGSAANEIFEEYRKDFGGKARTSVDLAQLERMLDELGELRRQMVELGKREPAEFNTRNEKVVSDRMQAYIHEHRAISDAQQGPQESTRSKKSFEFAPD